MGVRELGKGLGNPLALARNYSAIGSVYTIGTIVTHAGEAASKELAADGSSLLKAAYSELYAAIGDAYTQAFLLNPAITSSSLPSSTTWVDIAYGGGLFIAISSGGLTAVSSDFGATWQAGGSLPAATYTGIAYGSGVFVAIAAGVAFSASTADGVAWTQRVLPASAGWNCVAYGNGRFVAYGTSPVSAYSLDGASWVAGGTPGINDPYGKMAFGSGRFVVAAASGSIGSVSSTVDGVTWATSSLPGTRRANGLAYGNGFFAITGNTGLPTFYSWDGLAWIAGTSARTASLMAFYHGRFFLLPSTGTSIASFDYPDKFGTAITSPANEYNQAYAVGGGYMVVLSNASSSLAARFYMLTLTNFNLPNLQTFDPDKTAFVRVS